MAQITYENKVKINDNPNIPDINKVTDADMNEIKDVVNENYAEQSRMITNGNGYTKYADGTLICYGKTASANINAGSEYQENITLPQSYVDSNFVVLASIGGGASGWAQIIVRGQATSNDTVRIIGGNYITGSSRAQGVVINYITIGKWK